MIDEEMIDWVYLEIFEGYTANHIVDGVAFFLQIVKFKTYWRCEISKKYGSCKPIASLRLYGANEEQAKSASEMLINVAKEMVK